ncbi:DUF1934 domain-containing protein [Paenibacillus periandrae]|uniref:DUF1934 domain-containing protein n=1 Tax=Paenibacillus periandrae TaxID=1761741 RepID=UPI001F095BD1|nr:DUF1934 domain-containing protein [Paenibacillus periandrae]
MSQSIQVNIQIESRIDEDPFTRHSVEGDLYPKGDHYYLRYKDTDPEMAGTSTLIKLETGLVRIIRQGNVRSEQTFVAGQRLKGYYEAPHGKLELEAVTEQLNIQLEQGLGTVDWSYELFVMGERAGTYRLRLIISDKA